MTASPHALAGQIRVTARAETIGRTVVQVPAVRLEGPWDIGKEVVADGARLPANLSRLIPRAWGNASPAAWEAFARLAIAMGKL